VRYKAAKADLDSSGRDGRRRGPDKAVSSAPVFWNGGLHPA
jgi:hypothetical protein